MPREKATSSANQAWPWESFPDCTILAEERQAGTAIGARKKPHIFGSIRNARVTRTSSYRIQSNHFVASHFTHGVSRVRL